MSNMCRMYENKFPEKDELVMVNIREIADVGVYVRLLEYDNFVGMILFSEISRRRIRSVQKIIKIGRNEVAVVITVDKEKGYIDLSKRRVSPEEIQKCEEKYNKSKSVHSIMRHVAEKCNQPLEELYQTIGWPLYRKFGHANEAFKLAITEPEKVFDGMDIPETIYNELIENIKRRLTPQASKIRSDIEVTCFGYDGIDAVKEALLAGESVSTEAVSIKIKLVAPPLYVMVTHTSDKSLGIQLMEKSIEVIEENIKKFQGEVVVKMKPKAVTESDDKALAELMARVEKENAEISGDEDSEED